MVSASSAVKRPTYQYMAEIGKGNRYFCVHQTPFSIVYLLFWKRNILLPVFKPGGGSWRHFLKVKIKSEARRLEKRFKTFTHLMLFKFTGREHSRLIELPFYGQLCKPCHKSYRIFNIKKKTVVKLFDRDVEQAAVAREVALLKSLSHIGFVPSLRKWNIEERWYQEDYIDGSPESLKPRNSDDLLKTFKHDIAPRLIELMLFKAPAQDSISNYINQKFRNLKNVELINNTVNSKKLEVVSAFSDAMIKKLVSSGELSFCLTFSHGDFCPANVLYTDADLKIIDWESVEYRSAFFDFYSYFFYRPVVQNVSAEKLALEVQKAMIDFLEQLDLKAPALSKLLLAACDAHTYRHLYYLERLDMLLGRYRTDTNLDIMDYIFRYIQSFEDYERHLSKAAYH